MLLAGCHHYSLKNRGFRRCRRNATMNLTVWWEPRPNATTGGRHEGVLCGWSVQPITIALWTVPQLCTAEQHLSPCACGRSHRRDSRSKAFAAARVTAHALGLGCRGQSRFGIHHSLGPAWHRQDDHCEGHRSRFAAQVRRALCRDRRCQGRSRDHGGGADRTRPLRRVDGPVPRRDSPFH